MHSPDQPDADEVALDLGRRSFAWAKVLAAAAGQVGDPWLEAFQEEVLALGFCLIDLRLASAAEGDRRRFLGLLRDRLERLRLGRAWRRGRGRRPALPGFAPGVPGGGTLVPGWSERARRRMTRDRFEEFRRFTGLDTDVLVGKGENLAALVFYIAAYGAAAGGAPLTRTHCQALLEASRACAIDLERAVQKGFTRVSSPVGALPAAPQEEAVRTLRAAS